MLQSSSGATNRMGCILNNFNQSNLTTAKQRGTLSPCQAGATDVVMRSGWRRGRRQKTFSKEKSRKSAPLCVSLSTPLVLQLRSPSACLCPHHNNHRTDGAMLGREWQAPASSQSRSQESADSSGQRQVLFSYFPWRSSRLRAKSRISAGN